MRTNIAVKWLSLISIQSEQVSMESVYQHTLPTSKHHLFATHCQFCFAT